METERNMTPTSATILPALIEKHHARLVEAWLTHQKASAKTGPFQDDETAALSARFVSSLHTGAAAGNLSDIGRPEWQAAREILADVSHSRAARGSTPSETAMFVFSLKAPLFELIRTEPGLPSDVVVREMWAATLLLDKLGLYTIETFQKNREDLISRQQEELLELSTPVVQLWDGILALPLIGTLDSARTQVVMENLLQEIVNTSAEIAIIDITGVPTVDTLVAQHLLKTISAARLMGADCIISGIRPQIAQTIVHLGVELDVISKATMADAFALALRRTGKTVTARAAASGSRE